MSSRTLPDNSLPNRLDIFTDREHILNQFKQLLVSAQPGQFHLLAVKGNSGTGKTFLIEYLCRRVCPSIGWQAGHLTFAQSVPDFRSILEGLEDAFKGSVPRESLNQYRIKRNEFNRSFDEYRATITINQSIVAKEQAFIFDVNLNAQVNVELRRRELQLRAEQSRALVELSEECQHSLCLFIDGYERLSETDPELVGWLWENILLKLAKHTPQSLLVVTCGWEWPGNAAIEPFCETSELDDFDQVQIRSYLEKQGVIDVNSLSSEQEEVVAAFHDLTRGHPLVLSLAVTYFNALEPCERTVYNLRADRPLIDEKARIEFLGERLLSRLQEPYRTLLEHGPILRNFDQAALQALLIGEAENVVDEIRKLDDRTYDSFLRYPFIRQLREGSSNPVQIYPAFHELVRSIGLSALRRHHPETKEKLHITMANYYSELAAIECEKEKIPSTDNTNSLEGILVPGTWTGG